jgi:hypothetical protein
VADEEANMNFVIVVNTGFTRKIHASSSARAHKEFNPPVRVNPKCLPVWFGRESTRKRYGLRRGDDRVGKP